MFLFVQNRRDAVPRNWVHREPCRDIGDAFCDGARWWLLGFRSRNNCLATVAGLARRRATQHDQQLLELLVAVMLRDRCDQTTCISKAWTRVLAVFNAFHDSGALSGI